MGPPFPEWGFGPRTPTVLHYPDCGDRTFNPALVIWKQIVEPYAPLDSLIPPFGYEGGSSKGVRPLLRRELLSVTRRGKNAPTGNILPLL